MAIGNMELCFPKHLLMVTARMKSDKVTEEVDKMRRVNTESTAGTE